MLFYAPVIAIAGLLRLDVRWWLPVSKLTAHDCTFSTLSTALFVWELESMDAYSSLGHTISLYDNSLMARWHWWSTCLTRLSDFVAFAVLYPMCSFQLNVESTVKPRYFGLLILVQELSNIVYLNCIVYYMVVTVRRYHFDASAYLSA